MHALIRPLCCSVILFILPAFASDPLHLENGRCLAVCADLANLIHRDPKKLVMGLEDALVINEACAREIVSIAVDAVNADPKRVRLIFETAMKVVPQRADEVRQAIQSFSVPAALLMAEPVLEVRRAEIPNQDDNAALVVRRAQLPSANGDVPIPEVRRAEIPATSIMAEEMRRADSSENLQNVPKAKSLRKRTPL